MIAPPPSQQLFAMRAQVNEAMLLKFGQVVDLKKLEVLQSNPVLDEKRAQIRSLEMEGMKEIVLVKEKVEQKRRELMGVVQDNTVRLKRMYELLTLEREISRRLDARQKSMVRLGNREGGGRGVVSISITCMRTYTSKLDVSK